MRNQILTLSLLASLSAASFSAFAEPPVQAGETLESLSKAKVSTTVNGQPGSLNDLLSSGQIKLVNDSNTTAAAQTAPAQGAVAEPQAQPAQVEQPVAAQPEANSEAPQLAEPAN